MAYIVMGINTEQQSQKLKLFCLIIEKAPFQELFLSIYLL